MYPGVGAFVLIRPAPTFYERINYSVSLMGRGAFCEACSVPKWAEAVTAPAIESDRDLTPCSFCKKRVHEDELTYASFVRESACRDCYRKLPVDHPLRVAIGATE